EGNTPRCSKNWLLRASFALRPPLDERRGRKSKVALTATWKIIAGESQVLAMVDELKRNNVKFGVNMDGSLRASITHKYFLVTQQCTPMEARSHDGHRI